jgi:hypothetical protein
MIVAMIICRSLLAHFAVLPLSLARPIAGSSSDARMAMIATTTSNSISVKARRLGICRKVFMAEPPAVPVTLIT